MFGGTLSGATLWDRIQMTAVIQCHSTIGNSSSSLNVRRITNRFSKSIHSGWHRQAIVQPDLETTKMKLSRIALIALAAAVSLSAMPGLVSSAIAGPYDWMSNKPYVACLKVATYRAELVRDHGGGRAGYEMTFDSRRRACNMAFGYPDY
jgi:hypothetical protein